MSGNLRTRLAHIESQINAFEIQIARLPADHQAVREELAAVVYPILTLLNEITSEIFLHFARDCEHALRAPVLLSSICSHWRRVALSTPSLWTRFEAASLEENGTQMSVFLELWLSRAGGLPLDM
ncbi:hypothetical protein FB45DRAFT_758014 [Roridomyces roridus]|uniref:F-box domain-containing protein n=1 Tax=Roridomyces roridus TaxID=1738132 RepID=A0AAD7FC64_9AGAR|nr:hypothetical protein FB45DRAFT_758014 [Roridomyces roridus]